MARQVFDENVKLLTDENFFPPLETGNKKKNVKKNNPPLKKKHSAFLLSTKYIINDVTELSYTKMGTGGWMGDGGEEKTRFSVTLFH